MARYTLTYFDFDGGRGEPVRIALHAAGIEFEDRRWSFQEFGQNVGSLRFQAVPTLEFDGGTVTQSNGMLRYVGKLAGLYPEDATQQLHCDEVMGALEDLSHALTTTLFLDEDAKKAAREKMTETKIRPYLRGFAELLERGGGEYIAGGELSVADLKLFVQVRSLLTGVMDYVPKDVVAQEAPSLVAHHERVANDPRVVAYYASC